MSNHARLSPSNVRWVHCPGSVREESDYPESTSEAALSGTCTHFLLEKCINEEMYPNDFLGQTLTLEDGHEFNVDNARCKRVLVCIEYIDKRIEELEKLFQNSSVRLFAESKSNPGKSIGRTDWFGTCDVTLVLESDEDKDKVLHIEVIDYKDGGMYVDINDNSQLLAYLKGKCDEYQLEEITSLRMTIVQPKILDKPIRHQNLTNWSLEPLVEKLITAASATDDPDASLISGKHCHWCLHKPNCEEITRVKIEEINKMDGGESSIIQAVHTDLKTMPLNKLADILDAESSFKDAFERARAEAKLRAEAGEIVANDKHQYMIGNGRKSKAWNESDAVIASKLKNMKVIKDDIYPSKLLTPAVALKLDLSAKQMTNLKKLISEVDGKLTLIKTDRVAMSAEQMFSDVANKQIEHSEEPSSEPMSFL